MLKKKEMKNSKFKPYTFILFDQHLLDKIKRDQSAQIQTTNHRRTPQLRI